MPDGRCSDKPFEHILIQHIGDQSLRTELVQVAAVAGDNAARLLSAMLLREQAKLAKS